MKPHQLADRPPTSSSPNRGVVGTPAEAFAADHLQVCETAAAYITSHRELRVYRRAFDLALVIEDLADSFPTKEKFRLQDQLIRSSRSVCASIAEAWRKRRYEAAFVAKLSDAEAECGETQCWLEFALARRYVDEQLYVRLDGQYEALIGSIVGMISHADRWTLKCQAKRP